MSIISIKKYKEEDWAELKAIFLLNVPKFFALGEIEYLKKHLLSYIDTYHVATIDNQIVGAGGYYIVDKMNARLSWFFIHPDYHHRGIGKSLAVHALKHINDMAINNIEVWTSQYAQDFFSKFGFSLIYTKEDYWAPGIHLFKMKIEQF